MKRLGNMLFRAGMCVLTLAPLCAGGGSLLMTGTVFACAWFAVQTLIIAFAALLPAYVGSYKVQEMTSYAASRMNDPNPDRELIRETVKTGHRFPIRMTVFILLLAAALATGLLLPGELFQSTIKHVMMAGAMGALAFTAMLTLPGNDCVWTQLPGVVLGFLNYTVMALVLHFGEPARETEYLMGACALAYVFMGGISLNRQGLSTSSGGKGEDKRPPINVVRKNRRIVIGFALAVSAASFVKPIKAAALWVWAQIKTLMSWIAWLLRGGQDVVEEGNIDALLQRGDQAVKINPENIEAEADIGGISTMDKIFLIAFFSIVGLGALWLIFSGLAKLSKKLSELLERFRVQATQGYYDEKENLMEGDENRRHARDMFRDRLKNLFKRETPWEKLSAREKARRLVKNLYLRQGGKINGLKTLTARQAIEQIGPKCARQLSEVYDVARYSELPVEEDSVNELKKELR
ncbi:MAG: hypothetical protein K5784_10825 [Clostridiales bacterium]|nr:hypothetical protein [Clostridiales bacterium]